MKRILSIILVCAVVICGLTGCSSKKNKDIGDSGVDDNQSKDKKEVIIKNQDDPIVIRTMSDTEGQIMGKMMVLILRENGYEVEDHAGTVSGTKLGRTALLEKQNDIYLEYTGRGLYLIKDVDKSLFLNMETAHKTVKDFDVANGLTWLKYAPINNTDAVCVTKKFSEDNNIKTISELAKYIKIGKPFKMAMSDYWEKLATGLPGIENKYGIKLKDDQKLVMSGIEQAVAEKTDGIVAGHIYGTSGFIKPLDLVVLKDIDNISPVYAPCAVIRTERLDKYKEIGGILDKLFSGITLDEQLEMNSRVQAEGDEPDIIAGEYLKQKGFIK